jgi:Zn finger protein HypA/HybF involved in hydrogenase expression
MLQAERQMMANGHERIRLTIPDVWRNNIAMAERYTTIRDRLKFRRGALEKGGVTKTCRRCKAEFKTEGRRAVRCPDCQRAHRVELSGAYHYFGKERIKVLIWEVGKCSGFENNIIEDLEVHMLADKQHKILCSECHDKAHQVEPSTLMDERCKENPDFDASTLMGEQSTLIREPKNNLLKEESSELKKKEQSAVFEKTAHPTVYRRPGIISSKQLPQISSTSPIWKCFTFGAPSHSSSWMES